MSVPVGITVPKLLPITGTFIPAFSLYYIFLGARVSQERMQHDIYLANRKSSSEPASTTIPGSFDLAVRSHANFAEWVPIALLTGAIVELNGGNRKVLTGGLSALLFLRVLHVEFGMRSANNLAAGRLVGHFGTVGFLAGMAGYAAYLVKGYWGM